jgi:hypothetical protein
LTTLAPHGRSALLNVSELAAFLRVKPRTINRFSPDEVTLAIDRLFEQPAWNRDQLYRAILDALKQLQGRLADKPRTVDMVATLVSSRSEFPNIESSDVEQAVRELTSTSQGGIILRGGSIVARVSLEEIERRLRGLIGTSGEPRRGSQFRETESASSLEPDNEING